MSDDLFALLAELWVKGAALLAGAWLLARLPLGHGRRPWRAAFFGLALLSVLSAFPALWEWRLPARPATVLHAASEAWSNGSVPVVESPAPSPRITEPGTEVTVESPRAVSWPILVLQGWLVGVVAVGSWLALGHFLARRWTRRAEPVRDESWQALLREESTAMAVKREPHLAMHPAVPGPCTVGVRRPVILLPPEAVVWDAGTRRAVLRHELAHVAARDGLCGLVRGALLALHWPNPLVWLAATLARREEELAADRAVLAGGTEPRRYAGILLSLARKHPPRLIPAAGLPMARLTDMEGRFQAILTGAAPLTRAWWRHFARAAAVAGVVGAGCSQFQKSARHPEDLAPHFERTTVSLEKLEQLLQAPSFAGRLVSVRCRVIDANGRSLPADCGVTHPAVASAPMGVFDLRVRVPKDRRAKLESVREFVFPDGFDLPETKGLRTPLSSPADGGVFPVTPTTPKSFGTRETGWSLDLRWAAVEGPFVMLEGSFQETTFDGFIDCPGEAFSPIVTGATTALGRPAVVMLTENRVMQPTFTTRETPFKVAALPGKTYRLPLNLRQRGAVLEVTVEAAE